MLSAAEQFLLEIKSKENRDGRWLTFAGTSGTGKTFLSEIIFQIAASLGHLVHHVSLCNGVHQAHWPTLSRRLKDGEYWRIDDLCDANFLFLDEIGTSFLSMDALVQILLGRVHKWTVITCNKKLDWISENLDARVASRMVRDGSVLIEVDTIDFSQR